jgi:hypothetical protein
MVAKSNWLKIISGVLLNLVIQFEQIIISFTKTSTINFNNIGSFLFRCCVHKIFFIITDDI